MFEKITWTCPKCGFKNPNDYNVCFICGEKYTLLKSEEKENQSNKRNPLPYIWRCPTCGRENEMQSDCCWHCGEMDRLPPERFPPEKQDTLQNIKDSNPKDSIGIKKASMSYVPAPVLMEAALGMMEGGFKYRRHNYRVIGVRASVYYDATIRHLMAYWEGENIDPDSGLSHLTKAICSLIVWRDAELAGKYVDDRPPKVKDGWISELNKKVVNLMEKYPNQKPPYTELDKSEK